MMCHHKGLESTVIVVDLCALNYVKVASHFGHSV